ncbi:hypothetical protein HDU93_007639 [Gonapodya sp. JEL0774]|nr:hypothetical protein HDU93_007639 [Gonapodya sp. JEL0774]
MPPKSKEEVATEAGAAEAAALGVAQYAEEGLTGTQSHIERLFNVLEQANARRHREHCERLNNLVSEIRQNSLALPARTRNTTIATTNDLTAKIAFPPYKKLPLGIANHAARIPQTLGDLENCSRADLEYLAKLYDVFDGDLSLGELRQRVKEYLGLVNKYPFVMADA